MDKIKSFCTVLVPNIFILLYAFCLELARNYSSRYFTMEYVFLVMILGNIIFAIIILYTCKNEFVSLRTGSRIQYILSVLIIPLLYLISFIPSIKLSISVYIFSSIPYYFIFASINIGLFIFSLTKKKRLSNNSKDKLN